MSHGHTTGYEQSSTYTAWCNMKSRCFNTNNERFSDYGGRGISVESSWLIFENFLRDMGEKPAGFTLERRKNEEGYSKENCYWATYTEQNNNRREFKTPTNNKSGLKGVSYIARRQNWYASGCRQGKGFSLYQGPDFFEACCARKAYENKQIA